MKHFPLLLAATALLLTACSKGTETQGAAAASSTASATEAKAVSPKDLIQGKWKFADMESSQMNAMMNQPGVKDVWEKQLSDMRASSTVDFHADGTYTSKAMSNGEWQESKGKWEMAEDGKTMKMEDVTTHEMNDITLLELSGQKLSLTWSIKEDKWSMTYVR